MLRKRGSALGFGEVRECGAPRHVAPVAVRMCLQDSAPLPGEKFGNSTALSEGRAWTATGVFTSRGGPGPHVLLVRGPHVLRVGGGGVTSPANNHLAAAPPLAVRKGCAFPGRVCSGQLPPHRPEGSAFRSARRKKKEGAYRFHDRGRSPERADRRAPTAGGADVAFMSATL